MGRMIEGRWTTEWYPSDAEGRFLREPTRFHGAIDPAGPHPPAAGRYHLYVSHACPWAHRTLILRALKGLEEALSVTVVDPHLTDDGWHFAEADPDPLQGARFLREVYLAADPRYTGRVTVPVLWDEEAGTLVNNESREIMRFLDHAFQDQAAHPEVDLAPLDLLDEVERVLDAIYSPINDGVYRCGFAETQEAYDEAVEGLFEALEHWDGVLADQRFLCGDRMTEADVALFTTLVRFDPVYYTHFKCNRKHIWELPNLWRLGRDVYETPGVAETVDFAQIKTHYYWSHDSLNPRRIVPSGPTRHLGAPG